MLSIHTMPKFTELLTTPCEPCGPLNAKHIAEMFTLLKVARGLGLAAPQVGINRRFFVTHWNEIFVNPRIERVSNDIFDSIEGCLSIPGQRFMVPRWREVTVFGKTYHGEQAVVIQHEIEHLDGRLISRGTLVK